MATVTQPAAAPTANVLTNSAGPQNDVLERHAVIALTANVTANDIVELFKLPRNAIVVGGYVNADRIDTNASATFALSLGYSAGIVAAAAPTALLPSKVLPNTAVAGSNFIPIAPTTFTALTETLKVALTYTAVAATFAAGNIAVVVQYITPTGGSL